MYFYDIDIIYNLLKMLFDMLLDTKHFKRPTY